MAVWSTRHRVLVTAAPGTGSTALRLALLDHGASPIADDRSNDAGVDAKHGTIEQFVEAGFRRPAGAITVTTVRHPQDFFVAEWWRSRNRWVDELDDPTSWIHRRPGLVDQVRSSRRLGFERWLDQVLEELEPAPDAVVNRGHVAEADIHLRMEHLDADLADRLPHLAAELLPVPVANRSERRRDWWRHYRPDQAEQVGVRFARFMDRFGYRVADRRDTSPTA